MTLHGFLGMYDMPAQHQANDRIWTAIADLLRASGVAGVPRTLSRDIAPDRLWRGGTLLFGQACGYPLIARSLPLRVLALPVYKTEAAAGGRHRSLLVARRDDPAATLAAFRHRRAAINDPASNSGMNLFRATIAPLADRNRFFADVVVTGSHRDSIGAVLRGDADLAAIDSVSHAGFARFEPDLVRPLRIVAQSPASPTLPFVTARETPVETVAALRKALDRVIADPAHADARAALFLTGVVAAPAYAFTALAAMERHAVDAGYPALA